MMTDTRKFMLLTITAAALIGLILSYTILQDHGITDLEGYLQRKAYYERAISKKGLSLHQGLYWKEKQ